MKSRSTTYRIFSLTLAFLMFFTSIGFSIDMHYCKGQLKTINLFGKAKSCHEIGQGMKNCPHHKKMMEAKKADGKAVNEKDCCTNKTVHLQADLDQQYPADKAVEVNSQLQAFLLAFVEAFLPATVSETENPTYAHYHTPEIPRDIYVLLETYLL